MTGRSDVFFWVENLHARYFFGSTDLSRIFLGLKKIRVFFWVLTPSELFVAGFRCDQRTRKIFIRTSFQRRVFRKSANIKKTIQWTFVILFLGWKLQCQVFFGSKISGLRIFLGLQYEAPSDPPVMYTSSTPPPPPPGILTRHADEHLKFCASYQVNINNYSSFITTDQNYLTAREIVSSPSSHQS